MQTSVLSSPRETQFALSLLSLIVLFSMVLAPLSAFAASKKPEASFTNTSLSTESLKPMLRGTATSTEKVTVTIYKEDSSKAVFTKKNVPVKKNGAWSVRVSKSLAKGMYDIKITTGTGKSVRTLDTDTLAIGKSAISEKKKQGSAKGSSSKSSEGTVTVTTVPLLTGGTVQGNQSVPVSYLQVRNSSKDAVTVSGFTLKQYGTAPTNIITGLSVSDNLGGSRASSTPNPFKDGSGFVPTDATIPAGGFKIFTIKATTAANVFAAYGKDLKLDVTSVHTNGTVKTTYPLRGTTWSVGF